MKPREVLEELYNAYMNDDMCCRDRLVSEVEDLVDRLEELEARKFKWHLMDEEVPPTGYGHYIIMGQRGAMYYADSYEPVMYMSYHFHVPNSRDNYKYADEVKAWAEIPPMEEAE